MMLLDLTGSKSGVVEALLDIHPRPGEVARFSHGLALDASRLPSSLYQLSINENQAQKGTYFINFLGASSSKGLIFPSSTASRIYRETVALFLSSIPNRSLSEALVK